MTTSTKPTVKEAKQVIDNNYQRFMDGQFIDPLSLDIIGYAVANELQLRDYLLGYRMETGDKHTALAYVNHLIEQGISEQYRHAFYTIIASMHYTLGDKDLANLALRESIALNPNYSLNMLLTRVFGSGWPSEAFDSMAVELHPKVLQAIVDIENDTIEQQFNPMVKALAKENDTI